jgi:hypothetical protein
MSDEIEWVPVIWPDLFTEMLVNEQPGTPLFEAFVSLAMRTFMDKPDWLFEAADIGGVMRELQIDVMPLAEKLHAPVIYVYAVARGWIRLGVRGIALFAEALDVPMSRFFVDEDGDFRLEVRRYHEFRSIAPTVTILGGRCNS